MAKSRCPNLANLGLVTAAKSSERSPCTNGPVQCPISPCAEFEWKYNLKAHISTVHPTATLSRYKSHYELAKGEEVALRTISTTKKRKPSKKKISFRISTEHSTEAALGEFSRLSDDQGDEPDDESDSSSHSPSPDIEDERQSPTPLRPLSPMEEEDDLPSLSDLLTHSRPPAQSIEPRVQADSATVAAARVLTDDPVPAATDLSSSTTRQTTQSERPKPRRIAKRKLALVDSPADSSGSIVGPSAEQQLLLPTTRFGRVPKKSKKLVVLSDDDNEDVSCCIQNCMVVDANIPMVTCRDQLVIHRHTSAVWVSKPRIPIHPRSGIAMTIVGKIPAGEVENARAKIN
ncbi:hypothetical protein B0H10DRAFT_2202838 [Mycena sp. CBHHK59/15]|nr:hypothetical protein B0H10DRAFT_2202838 [Mycena sp. CBHHK59/15]